MSNIKAPFDIRIKNSLSGISRVLVKPKYIVLSLVSSFFISGFVIWALNFDLVHFIAFESPLNLAEKLRFFWDVQTSIYTTYESTQATGIILFGLLFGVNFALVVYVIRTIGSKNIPKKVGGAGLFFALLSGGCIACGTSILAPILATLGATSSAFSAELSNYLNWISILLILFSIYKLGSVISNSRNKTPVIL